MDFIIRRNKITEELIKNYEIAVAFVVSGRYLIAYATEEVYNEFNKLLGVGVISSGSIVMGLLDRAGLESSGILQVHRQPFLDLRGQGVIIGFVDTGIDYTQEVFRYEDGSSKILYLYDQTVEGPPPPDYYLGTEYTNEQINTALSSDNPSLIVPETDTSGHGTFLASVAAGREVGDFIGAAPDADIIAVKLRRARPYYLKLFSVPETQENAYESNAVILGIEYILQRAFSLNRPVVICLGLGSNFGSHDAYSIFESYLNNISKLTGVCLCIAAGNESQARHHTDGVIAAAGETFNIDIKAGENAGDIFLSVWTGVSDRVSVSVRSPTGELVPRVPARSGMTTRTPLILEDSSVEVTYFFPVEGTGGQLSAVKIINATSGIWTVTVHGDLILDGRFHSWLPLTGFVSPTVEYLAANPNFTITVPATMDGAIICGAYNYRTGGLYSMSSWGPTRTGYLAPDLVAPGVNISGFYPYGPGTMDGTSVATAITSGAAALMLQWGIVKGNDVALSTYQIRAYLVRGCDRSESMAYPNNRWGYGSLNLYRSFQLMREI
ncbi:MAG: S8 family peptidase [Eubacteriales bacterium]|nr:S8 family peptidase [Eubacteriales bacterium]